MPTLKLLYVFPRATVCVFILPAVCQHLSKAANMCTKTSGAETRERERERERERVRDRERARERERVSERERARESERARAVNREDRPLVWHRPKEPSTPLLVANA
jgi:hypothetical protein